MLALHDFMTFMFLEFSFLARWASEDRNIEKLRRSSDWIEQNPSSVVKPANLPNVVARPWAKSRNEPHGWDRNQTSVEAASHLIDIERLHIDVVLLNQRISFIYQTTSLVGSGGMK